MSCWKHIQGVIVSATWVFVVSHSVRVKALTKSKSTFLTAARRAPECFPFDFGLEIFPRGSVGAVSYNCTDDNKYRARRAVKSNRLRLWALYNQQPPVARLFPARRRYNLLTNPCIKTYFPYEIELGLLDIRVYHLLSMLRDNSKKIHHLFSCIVETSRCVNYIHTMETCFVSFQRHE